MNEFITYDEASETLSIEEGATTDSDIGEFQIKLSLQDVLGTDSETLNLYLNISLNEEVVEISESEDLDIEVDSEAALAFSELLKEREAKRLEALRLGLNNLERPTVTLLKPNEVGQFQLLFSKAMIKIPELESRISSTV